MCSELLCPHHAEAHSRLGHDVAVLEAGGEEEEDDTNEGAPGDDGFLKGLDENRVTAVFELLEQNPHVVCHRLLRAPATFSVDTRDRIPSAAWEQLRERGYVVMDALVPEAVALAAAAEALADPVGSAFTSRVPLSNGDAPCVGAVATVARALEALGRELVGHMRLASPTPEFELERRPAGAHGRQRSRDACPNDGSLTIRGPWGRRVACAAYLTSTGGAAAQRLHAPRKDPAGELEAVDLAFCPGTAVLYLAGALEHEQLAVPPPQCVLTAWFR
jgi:hypothetical protein